MVKKKTDETGEVIEGAEETQNTEAVAEDTVEAKPKRAAKKAAATDAPADEPSIVDSVIDTATAGVQALIDTVADGAASIASLVTGDDSDKKVHRGKRAEKIGVVTSDKMTKTVVVRVDRLIKHPVYRKYVRKRKKFMAHDELESKIGDKVRIVETRPLSARKRWRVVEIIQKAEL
ncbi:MAG: 30S ribosomal protein S17 [Acidobacteriota bacterium]